MSDRNNNEMRIKKNQSFFLSNAGHFIQTPIRDPRIFFCIMSFFDRDYTESHEFLVKISIKSAMCTY